MHLLERGDLVFERRDARMEDLHSLVVALLHRVHQQHALHMQVLLLLQNSASIPVSVSGLAVPAVRRPNQASDQALP